MALLTAHTDIWAKMAQGKGMYVPCSTLWLGTSPTAAAIGTGAINVTPGVDINTATFTTPISIKTPSSVILRHILSQYSRSNVGFQYLARLYTLGTIVVTSTGDKLTHDAATFPVTRKQFGVAAQPVTLLPFIYCTTTVSGAATPTIRFRTVAGAAGYKSQDGTSVIGTVTMVFPASVTNGSGYIMRLENADSGIQDITNIECTVATTAGIFTIFGLELLCALPHYALTSPFVNDSLFGGFAPVDIAPAVATSGTATSYLVIVGGGTTGPTNIGIMQGVLDT